ncbi:MAG: ATP-binding cassette domain-containing protein, partial [Arenimonas sp.]|nr:ATP-binding cassette domain-containing protein [Arenimonas sp.]
MSKIIIQGAGLAKTYQEGPLSTPVFSGIDVQVLAGESLAIVGASGSGKSTLLHLLAGLDKPTAGLVKLMSQPLQEFSEAERGRLRNRH